MQKLQLIPESTISHSFSFTTDLLENPSNLHLTLCDFNHKRLSMGDPNSDWAFDIWNTIPLQIAEGQFLERERDKVRVLAQQAPRDTQGFLEWFQAQQKDGLGQFDPLFDWLAESADYEQVRWFIQQEFAGEAGFDDLIALAQLKLPEQAKLGLARNYWDEMGRGKAASMHGPLLNCLAEELKVTDTPTKDLAWEALALSNLMVGLAANRRFAFHALGGLGAVELTSPTRATKVAEALERVGLSRNATYYFRLHATVDITHAEEWKREVLAPIVAENPSVAVHIAEGVLMRLNAGARCFDCYRLQFGLDAPKAYVE